MDDLVRWLSAQLDEDERIARRAADYDDGAAHDVPGPPGTWSCLNESEWFGPSYRGGVIAPRIGNVNAPELGAHIVCHDPARVLREVDAKRKLLADHPIVPETYPRATVGGQEVGGPYFPFGCENCHVEHDTGEVHGFGCCLIWKALALPYADRPGYREEWRP